MRENSKLFNRVSDQFLRSRIPVSEAVYRGSFTVTEGDYLPAGVAQVGSYVHIEKSRFYQVQCIRTGSRKSQRPDFIGLWTIFDIMGRYEECTSPNCLFPYFFL